MPDQNPVVMSKHLRAMALATTADQLGFDVGPAEPFGVLMELGVQNGAATLVAFQDGTTSLYYSTGGGIIGGGEHEAVRAASQRFVRFSSQFVELMQRTETFPLPANGMVRFYLMVVGGVLTREEGDASLSTRRSPLSALYLAGHEVLTQLRLIDQQRRR